MVYSYRRWKEVSWRFVSREDGIVGVGEWELVGAIYNPTSSEQPPQRIQYRASGAVSGADDGMMI